MSMKTAQTFKVALALLVAMVMALGSCNVIVTPDSGSGITVIGVIDVNAHAKTLDAWCNNFTGILLNTFQQFGSVGFNRTAKAPGTGITELARLTKDHRDLSIYNMLLSDINTDVNTTVGKQVDKCIGMNKRQLATFLGAMQSTKQYLNGTNSNPPTVTSTTTPRQTYTDISRDMVALMAHFRKLTEMFGKYFAASIIVR